MPRYRDPRYTHLLVIEGLLRASREKVSLRGRKGVGLESVHLQMYWTSSPRQIAQSHKSVVNATAVVISWFSKLTKSDQLIDMYRTAHFSGRILLSKSMTYALLRQWGRSNSSASEEWGQAVGALTLHWKSMGNLPETVDTRNSHCKVVLHRPEFKHRLNTYRPPDFILFVSGFLTLGVRFGVLCLRVGPSGELFHK